MISSALFSTVMDGGSITFRLVSDLTFVHPTLRLAANFAVQFGAKDTSRICIALRELLSNAIVHGNQNVPERMVDCTVEPWSDGQFKITVRDEGEGFDYESLDLTLTDNPWNIRNRGYILLNRVCKGLKFNALGNEVTALVSGAESIGMGNGTLPALTRDACG